MSTDESQVQNELEKKIEEYKKLVELKELEKKYAEAQKATIEAMYPKGETKPLKGEIKTDEKSGYIAELVSYQAMKEKAASVGTKINNKNLDNNSKILIVDKLNFLPSYIPLIQLEKQFTLFNEIIKIQKTNNEELLEKALKLLEPETRFAVLPSLPTVPLILGTIADIAGYFQVNYSFKGQEFELHNDALTATIAESIEYETHVLNFKILLESKTSKTTILDDFITFLEKKQEFEETIDKLKHASARSLLTEIKSAMIESENIVATCNYFVKSITSTPNENSQSLLVQAALMSYIAIEKFTHLLYLNIVSSGGEAVTQKTIWPWWRKISFIGGSVFSYILAEITGKVILADVGISLSQLDYKLCKGASDYKKIALPLKKEDKNNTVYTRARRV